MADVAASPVDDGPAEEAPPEEDDGPDRDIPRGHVGFIYTDVFKDLYAEPPKPEPKAHDADAGEEGAAGDAGEGAGEGDEAAEAAAPNKPRPWETIDLSAEDEEIEQIRAGIDNERTRIDGVMGYLKDKQDHALKLDFDEAKEAQARWSLTMREQIPVPESKLRTLLDHGLVSKEKLIAPKDMMANVERQLAIRTGQIGEHENLLNVSKPEAPNYLNSNGVTMNRLNSRNIQPRLTEAQRTTLAVDLAERNRQRPAMPPVLNAEERAKNREIVKRMQTKVSFLKNPRYVSDRAAAGRGEPCPFFLEPDRVVFRNYEVGGVYEVVVELKNVTRVGRRVKVLPCKSEAFSTTPLRYDSEETTRIDAVASAVVAPGLSARFAVRFAPHTLNDQDETVTISTEQGDWTLPVIARRVQPVLEFEEPVNCGCILAGQQASRTVLVTNRGGEGSFRLIPADESGGSPSHQYETEHESGETTFASANFSVVPASFYLETEQSISLTVHFHATVVGQYRYPMYIEGDNGEKTTLTLVAITDVVRLELLKWPSLSKGFVQPRAVEPHESPWSLVPWQLNWLQPGAQVGCSESQSIVISNGGFLPMKVQWRLVQPPQTLLSRLGVGGTQRLSDNVLKTIHMWKEHDRAKHGLESCPFTVSPVRAQLQPFSQATFTFTFYSHAPAGHCATAFAYLSATHLPANKYCLLHYNRLLALQSTMQPEGYQKGLPLFGGAVGAVIDSEAQTEENGNTQVPAESKDSTKPSSRLTSSCAMTAICLQGRSIAPSVTCVPPLLALSGDVLPFVAHAREIKLQNRGPEPAYFRFRLTSSMTEPMANDVYDTLWIVGAHEVKRQQSLPAEWQGSELQLAAERLATEWPPLPPDGEHAALHVGFGALATVALEPHEGKIAPGSSATIRVTMRITQEADLDAPILVDLPTSLEANAASVAQPLKIRLLAASRAPRVEVKSASFLDFGVVRAHSRHTLKMRVDNPSDLPTLVRLKHHHEAKAKPIVPVTLNRRPSLDGPPTARSGLADGATPNTPRGAQKHAMTGTLSEARDSEDFPFASHQDVVNLFINSARSGNDSGAEPLEAKLREPDVQPWVHARSGCLDESGRRPFKVVGRGGPHLDDDAEDGVPVVSDAEDFIFRPECLAIFPHQSAEVEVTLRTRAMEKYNALVEIMGFDSLHSQCIEAFAEVQLPRLRLSTQHAHFPVTYVKTASVPFELKLWNDSDMPAHFSWTVPVKLEACIECQIDPMQGVVPPRGSKRLNLVAVPTREAEHAELLCSVFVQDVMQPLALKVSARVYGPEVDYAVVPVGEAPPLIKHLPRRADDPPGRTCKVLTGKAPSNTPICDFGKMELLKTRSMQLVLYNRTGIPTPYGVRVDKNPAWDPLAKGKKIGGLLEAATKMYAMATASMPETTTRPEEVQTFAAEPQPVQSAEPEAEKASPPSSAHPSSAGTMKKTMQRQGSSKRTSSKTRTGKFAPKARPKTGKFLLDDKHERQAFRDEVGAEFARQKDEKKQGTVALKSGRGYAVSVEPSSDWLQPFSTAVINLTCYSDVPGLLQDELVVTIGQLKEHAEGGDYRVPIRLLSYGNPLYLPDQQVGLNSHMEPPRLIFETLTPVAKSTTRRFKVGNSAMTPVRLTFAVFPKAQVENEEDERQFVNLSLCGRGGQADGDPFGQPPSASPGAESDEDEGDEAEDPDAEAALAAADLPPFEFQMWGNEPPKVEDPYVLPDGEPPVRIEPEEAIIPAQGTSFFTVTMVASKATATAGGHYHYKLVGKGRYTQEREDALKGIAPDASTETLNTNESTQRPGSKEDRMAKAVTRLPEIQLDDEELHDDDSDIEQIPSTRPQAESESGTRSKSKDIVTPSRARQERETTGEKPLGQEPDTDVISTIVLDCVGDCILPRLTVDKKGDPSVRDFADADSGQAPHCPAFKFIHSVVAPNVDKHRRAPGSKLGGAVGGTQHQNVVSCLVRQITLSNENSCSVSCRFLVEGPFYIRLVSQAGIKPVVAPRPTKADATRANNDAMRQLFVVPKRDTITLEVEYVPEMAAASSWTEKHEHVFRGDLIVQYPRDISAAGGPEPIVDLQRIHLVATSRRPAMRLDVVPVQSFDVPPPEPSAEVPPWAEALPVVIEFGYVHVESTIARKRVILLSNEANVVARWHLVHVGRKRRPPHEIGVTVREDEDFRALDDKDAFEFDITEADQEGPTRDGLMPDGGKRMPRWAPVTPALPQSIPHADDWKFEPRRVTITFKPQKNEVYKCRFRIQVEGGRSLDFICRGCGSYDEEDDAMEYQEA